MMPTSISAMQEPHPYQTVRKAIEYLDAHFQEQPSLEQIAEQVHLSPYHFQRMFVDWAGVSPKKFLQFLNLNFAKSKLKQQSSLAEIAHEAGLSGTSRLHDLFLKLEGMSPGVYKKGGAGMRITYGFYESPFGNYILAAVNGQICSLRFGEDPSALLHILQTEWPQAAFVEDQDALLPQANQIFQATWNPDTNWKLKLKGTAFQLKVWEALLKIPEGQLVTYQQIAEAIGKPSAARAVGTAIGKNPIAYLIPCHRVIRQTGQLGGYRWGLDRKQIMLGWEAAKTA